MGLQRIFKVSPKDNETLCRTFSVLMCSVFQRCECKVCRSRYHSTELSKLYGKVTENGFSVMCYRAYIEEAGA